MFSTITAVATSILDPVRRVAFAVAVEDENGKLVHFNSNATVASRHTRVTTGLLEAICEGIGHLSKDTQKVVIRLSSPRIGNSQSSAARLLIRRSIPGPKGANHQRQWAEIQGLLAGRIVTWKPVDFNSDDQLCALERTCLHCLEAPLGFPEARRLCAGSKNGTPRYLARRSVTLCSCGRSVHRTGKCSRLRGTGVCPCRLIQSS